MARLLVRPYLPALAEITLLPVRLYSFGHAFVQFLFVCLRYLGTDVTVSILDAKRSRAIHKLLRSPSLQEYSLVLQFLKIVMIAVVAECVLAFYKEERPLRLKFVYSFD